MTEPSKLRACRDCEADISDRHINAVSCRDCLKKRHRLEEREKYRRDPKGMAARKRELRRDPEKHCRELIRNRRRRELERQDNAPAYQQRLAKDRQRDRGDRPVFFYCPDDQAFDHWLSSTVASPPPPLPDLTHDPDPWQPFTVPDYLK